MDEKKFENDFKELLEEFTKDIRNRIEMQVYKLWKYDITLPLDFKVALNTFTKHELTKIRQNLDIKGLSSLNKGELIDRLIQLIPQNLNHSLYNFDETRYNFLKKIVARGSYVNANQFNTASLLYFKEYGLTYTGWKDERMVVAMPMEIVEAFKELDTLEYQKIIKRNTLWIELVKGMLYYYGVLNLDQIVENLEKYTGEKCDILVVLRVLDEATKYYLDFRHTRVGFKDSRVIDVDKILKEQKSRVDIPYYNFTKLQILRAAKNDYIEKNSQTNKFTKYLKENYNINNAEVDTFLDEISIMVNNDKKPEDIIKELEGSFEINSPEQFHLFSAFIIDIINNTRMWILKGHSPEEVAAKLFNMKDKPGDSNIVNFKTRKKVGRNDPCPCGSGKKYKRCCGK